MEWKDITPYKRGDNVRKPTGWQIEDDSKLLRITVVYGHIQAPNRWCFHCPQLGLDTVELSRVPQSVDAAEAAKAEATHCVIERLHCLFMSAVEMVCAKR